MYLIGPRTYKMLNMSLNFQFSAYRSLLHQRYIFNLINSLDIKLILSNRTLNFESCV